jgi:hypothetical protein
MAAMATADLAPTGNDTHRPRRRSVLLRLLISLLLLLLALVLASGFWVYQATKAALPQIDGSLAMAGIS